MQGYGWIIRNTVLLLVFVVLNILFAASEFSIGSLSRMRLLSIKEKNNEKADPIGTLISYGRRAIIGIRFGCNITKISCVVLIVGTAYKVISQVMVFNVIFAFIGAVFFTLFVDIIPRNMAAAIGQEQLLFIVRVLNLYMKIFSPLFAVFEKIVRLVVDKYGGNKEHMDYVISDEEIKAILELGDLESDEKSIIKNVFDFGDYRAKDIMVPRRNITAVHIDTSFDDIVNTFKSAGYSRLPVFREDTDSIEGILYLKDLAFEKAENFVIEKVMRQPFYTYENKPTLGLFKDMKENRISLALVLDEYGGTAGLITIEDFIEEILGDIPDEYDLDMESNIKNLCHNIYQVEGFVKIDEVNTALNLKIASKDYDSIGGYVTGLFGKIPEVGEEIREENITYQVLNVNKNRIEKLYIVLEEDQQNKTQ